MPIIETLENPATATPAPANPAAPEPPREEKSQDGSPQTTGELAGLQGSTIGQLLAESFEDEAEEKRRLRRVVAAAVVAHAIFFIISFPSWKAKEPDFVRPAGKIYMIQAARFEKPAAPPPSGAATPTKSLAKKIPIPDPTPDDPEPILDEDAVEVPETPLAKLNDVFFGIPGEEPGAPGAGNSKGTTGKDFSGDAFQLGSGSGIAPPVAIAKPEPRYTEEARRARIQGVVILSCVIDEQGIPRNLTVVKGLSLGLTESALETAKNGWRFKPATKDGKPVPVHFLITINFSLQ